MESSASDSDTSDEWIVLDNDEEYLKKISSEDELSGCIDCHAVGDISDARTASLEFREEGNPPDNNEIPPMEDLIPHEQPEDFVDQAEDMSDLSSCIKDELLADIDMTPAVRHYVHNKNVNLNSLLSIYLALAVTAALALGLGNFLGWSTCGILKGDMLEKQEQMLEQLQSELIDCISYLNTSNILSANSRSAKNSMLVEEIKFRKRNTDTHVIFAEEKNLSDLFCYPFLPIESSSGLCPTFRKYDKNDQISVLRYILYSQNIKPNSELGNVKVGDVYIVGSPEVKGKTRDLIFSRPFESHIPNIHSYSMPAGDLTPDSYKESLVRENDLNDKWKESLFNLKSKLNFHDLSVEKYYGDMAAMLGLSHLNIELPQKKGSESQEKFNFDSPLIINNMPNLKTSEIPDCDVKNQKLNEAFADFKEKYSPRSSTQESDHSNHIANLIYSMNGIISFQQMQNINEGSFERNLNVTQFVFQGLLENLSKKLEDIKIFTSSPLFVKHSHHGQKAVKKLMKAFINFVDKLLKHSDMFLQKNIQENCRMNKLLERILSNMNRLDCRWQEIKDKWHKMVECEQNPAYPHCREKFHSNTCNKKEFDSHKQKFQKDKPFHDKSTDQHKNDKFFNKKLKEQRNKAKHNGKEERYTSKTGKKLKNEKNGHPGNQKNTKQSKKEKHFGSNLKESKEKLNKAFWKGKGKSKKDITNNYKDKNLNKKGKSNNRKENGDYILHYQKF